MRHREPAICLRVTDYSETSQVVHFLTRSGGVVKLIAKGAKRPKSSSGGAIDLLAEGDLVYSARFTEVLGILIEFTETVSHAPLRRDAKRLNVALYMIELVAAMLAEGDPHGEVFDLLHNALGRCGQADAPTAAVLAYFQWRLLRHVGLLGELKRCVGCGRAVGTKAVYFSSRSGGLLCADCEAAAVEKYALDRHGLAGLAALAAAEAGRRVQLPDAQANAVNCLLAYHVAEQIGRPLKMARHVLAAGR